MLRFLEAREIGAFARLPRGGLFGGEPREIVPVTVVFGGVFLAEVPAFGAVRRLGRGAVAGLVAAVPVAQPHLGRLARGIITAPAGKPPVIGSGRTGHRSAQCSGASVTFPCAAGDKSARGPVSRVLSTRSRGLCGHSSSPGLASRVK